MIDFASNEIKQWCSQIHKVKKKPFKIIILDDLEKRKPKGFREEVLFAYGGEEGWPTNSL